MTLGTVRSSLGSARLWNLPLGLLCMLLVGSTCAGRPHVSTAAVSGPPCPRRSARSLVVRIVVARGEERFSGRSMLAYRRPAWVRGELYDGVGTLRASFLLHGDNLTVWLSDRDDVVTESPAWSGWDDVLGLPQGSSRLFSLLPLLLDPWAAAGPGPAPYSGTAATVVDSNRVRISFTEGRPETVCVESPDGRLAECSLEGGDACLAAERYTVDLVEHGVVVWIEVEADSDFPEVLETGAPFGN